MGNGDVFEGSLLAEGVRRSSEMRIWRDQEIGRRSELVVDKARALAEMLDDLQLAYLEVPFLHAVMPQFLMQVDLAAKRFVLGHFDEALPVSVSGGRTEGLSVEDFVILEGTLGFFQRGIEAQPDLINAMFSVYALIEKLGRSRKSHKIDKAMVFLKKYRDYAREYGDFMYEHHELQRFIDEANFDNTVERDSARDFGVKTGLTHSAGLLIDVQTAAALEAERYRGFEMPVVSTEQFPALPLFHPNSLRRKVAKRALKAVKV
jgi:hypothetical protein